MIVRSVGAFAPGLAATLEGFNAKLAVMLLAAFIVTTHDPVPVQAPPQPVKLEPLTGVALKVTLEALLKVAVQVVPQLMPAEVLETAPVPVPFLVMVSANVVGAIRLNVAVTDFAASIVTSQVNAVPVQAPLQPAKLEPLMIEAVNFTMVFWLNEALQIGSQLMPAGLLETLPDPVPALVIVKANVFAGAVLKIAVTDCAAFIATAQGPAALLHAPLQPAKTLPLAGAAISVIFEPLAKFAVQVAPQSIPATVLETVPKPVPVLVILSAKVVWVCGL